MLDTNVLLHIYQYSPDYSQFAINCIRTISKYIRLPSVVSTEFSGHNNREYNKAKKRVVEATKRPLKKIEDVTNALLKECDYLRQLEYPEIDSLKDSILQGMDELKSFMQTFFDDREQWERASSSINTEDHISAIVEYWKNKGQVHEAFTQEELYRLCSEGKDRYDKKTPPGFMDAGNKDGIRKYSDFIIWKETIKISKESNKNIIFVTDDMKDDWWQKDATDHYVFHEELTKEFQGKTSLSICPFTSKEFYEDISKDYDIDRPKMFELALHVDYKGSAEKVADDVFSMIESSLMFNADKYIDNPSEAINGIDEYEIEDYEYKDVEEVNDTVGKYSFIFSVKISGISYQFIDDDHHHTNDYIYLPVSSHVFEGQIEVLVSRETDEDMDIDSFVVEDATITQGKLLQTAVKDLFASDEDIEEEGEYYDGLICPDCGCRLTWATDRSGYCINCADNH